MGLFDGVLTIVSQGASAIGAGASQLGSAVGSAVGTVIGTTSSFTSSIQQSGASVTTQVLASQPTTTTGQAYYVSSQAAASPIQVERASPVAAATIQQQAQAVPTSINPPDIFTQVQSGLSGIGSQISAGIITPATQTAQNLQGMLVQNIPPAAIQSASVVASATPIAIPTATVAFVAQGILGQQQQIQQPIQTPYNAKGAGPDYTLKTIEPSVVMPESMTLFTSYGKQAQTEVKGVNAIYYDAQGGGFVATQIPYGHSISNIAAGGGTGSLQSGRFSLTPLTPIVYTQESGGTKFADTANVTAAKEVLANPEKFSNVGAEAYRGTVQKLDARVLTPETQMGRYPAETGNLANLVNPYGTNLPKAEWAEMPWNVPVGETAVIASYSGEGVATPASVSDLMSIGFKPTFTYTDIYGARGTGLTEVKTVDQFKSVGPEVTVAQTPAETFISGIAGAAGRVASVAIPVAATLGIPVISTVASAIATTETGSKVAAEILAPSVEPTKPSDYVYRSDAAAVALEGALYFGDVLTFGLWTPGKELLASKGQNINPATEAFRTDLSGFESRRSEYTALGESIEQQRTNLDILARGKIDASGKFVGTAEEYATYTAATEKLNADVAAYNKFGEDYQQIIQKGFESGAIIPSGEGYVYNPDLENPYGAFSAWERGAGQTVQRLLGQTPVTESQFLAYEQTQEFKEAGPVMQFGEGAYKVIATRPAEVPAAILQGVEVYAGFGLLNLGLATVAAPAAAGEAGAGVTSRVALASQGVLNSAAFQYGLGGLLVGGTVGEASGWGTLPSEQTYSRLGESSVPLVAMGWGAYAPEVGIGVARFADRQFAIPMNNEEGVLLPMGRAAPKADDITKALVPIAPERTVVQTTYDIARTTGTYRPEEGVFTIQYARDIIKPGKFGEVEVVQRTQSLAISQQQYAAATGAPLPESGATIGLTEATRFQTIREVYPSGRTYEFTIGRKGTVETPAIDVAGVIPSRGIRYGEITTAMRSTEEAEQIIATALPRGEKIGETLFPERSFGEYDVGVTLITGKGQVKSTLSPVDLPASVKDVTSIFGTARGGVVPGTEAVSSESAMTRIVRSGESAESISARLAVEDYGIQGGEGVTPREVLLPASMGGEASAAYGSFEVLPEWSVRVSEQTLKQPGLAEVSFPQPAEELLAGTTTEISTVLFGKEAQKFSSEAAKLLQGAGRERVVKTGIEVKRTGSAKGEASVSPKPTEPGVSVAAAPGGPTAIAETKAALDFAKLDFSKTETERIGGVVEELIARSRKAPAAEGPAQLPQEYVAPEGTPVPIEEEYGAQYFPAIPGMQRPTPRGEVSLLGQESVQSITRAQQQALAPSLAFDIGRVSATGTKTEPVVAIESAQVSRTALAEMTGILQGSRQAFGTVQANIGAQDYARVFEQTPRFRQGFGEDYARVYDQTRAQDYARVFEQIQRQIPAEDVALLPRTEPVRPYEQGGHIPPPPEIIIPMWPGGIPGQGGSGTGLKGFRARMEYTPLGLDISQFGVRKGANPFESPAGRARFVKITKGGFGFGDTTVRYPSVPKPRKIR